MEKKLRGQGMEKTYGMMAAASVIEEVQKAVIGKQDCIKKVMAAILAGGHVLIEDIPGVGKTTMAVAFSKSMGLDRHRVQFTPDVLPADIVGFSLYDRQTQQFVYQPGAVMCNLLLADEINRTSPKTQSALLEVMEERKVTVDGVTRELDAPFLVIATQNPAGAAGTQPLPEAQTDRFMISMSLGYPDYASELAMAKGICPEETYSGIRPALTGEALLEIQRDIHQIYIKDVIYEYLLKLVRATRSHPDLERGASPRATIALVKMAKACAWMNGRDYVIPRDVLEQFAYVAPHRILLSGTAKMEKKSKRQILENIMDEVQIPPVGEERR